MLWLLICCCCLLVRGVGVDSLMSSVKSESVGDKEVRQEGGVDGVKKFAFSAGNEKKEAVDVRKEAYVKKKMGIIVGEEGGGDGDGVGGGGGGKKGEKGGEGRLVAAATWTGTIEEIALPEEDVKRKNREILQAKEKEMLMRKGSGK